MESLMVSYRESAKIFVSILPVKKWFFGVNFNWLTVKTHLQSNEGQEFSNLKHILSLFSMRKVY